MPWWGWLVMAAMLLAFELFVIDAQFYLVFLGVSAALVGLISLVDGSILPWQQWLAFAGLSIATMLAFRDRVYQLVRKRTGHVAQPLTLGDRGYHLRVLDLYPPGSPSYVSRVVGAFTGDRATVVRSPASGA